MRLLANLFARRDFALPHFDPLPLVFEEAAEEGHELLLEDVVVEHPPVRAQPELRPVPTAGELRDSIERHLRREQARGERADAADELRNALVELRRSFG